MLSHHLEKNIYYKHYHFLRTDILTAYQHNGLKNKTVKNYYMQLQELVSFKIVLY